MTARFAPSRHDLRQVRHFDAADAENRELHELVHAADFFDADGGVVRFCGRGEERAEADVIRAFRLRRDGLRDAMGRFAEPAIFASDDLARRGDGEIVLAEVHAFHREVARDCGAVVDDERHAGGAR